MPSKYKLLFSVSLPCGLHMGGIDQLAGFGSCWLSNQISNVILHIAGDDDTTISARAIKYLVDWLSDFNKSYAVATSHQLSCASKVLEETKPKIGLELASRLAFNLKGW
jgi:hypothetical protein